MAANLDTIVEQETASLDRFVASYRPLPGIFDEMMDGDGGVRAGRAGVGSQRGFA